MKKFNFNSFVQDQYEQFKDSLSLEEVKDILLLEKDAYYKDNPQSTGKTLVLDLLAFKGEKDNGDIIDFKAKLKTGLTIWITKNSNLKGKSSIFKIIKFALTGDNSITPNVSNWIKEIFLSFTIGVHNYTIHIINKKGQIAKLYNIGISDWRELEDIQKIPLFKTFNQADFRSEIQDFFFHQFSYYSLKWTQSSSKKDSVDLLESSISWATYFKSIYLESKDYGVLFFGGNIERHQGVKLFQTLMGLDLTYAINQLTIKKDFLQNEKAKDKLKLQKSKSDVEQKKKDLTRKVSEINDQLAFLHKLSISPIDKEINNLQKEYNALLIKYEEANKLTNETRELQKEIENKEATYEQKRKDYLSLQNRINNIQKSILELKEHTEIGIFFSNLEVKNCPSCHHSIDETRKKTNLKAHSCPLCSDPIITTEEVDIEEHKTKIANLEFELIQANERLTTIKLEGSQLSQILTDQRKRLLANKKILELNNPNILFLQIQAIYSRISELISQNPLNNQKKEEYIAQKAVLEYQLQEIENDSKKIKVSDKIDTKIKLLEKSIEALLVKRLEIGKDIISRLEEKMLYEIQFFGISSITGVRITEKFDVKYLQATEEISFEKISEGEQLRAKLAFYLSLIQLDIEYSMGKHTRFLMIDSPGREEAGTKYMEGLISVLQNIQERFGDKLQILIATADSRFENMLKNEFVYPEETYIF